MSASDQDVCHLVAPVGHRHVRRSGGGEGASGIRSWLDVSIAATAGDRLAATDAPERAGRDGTAKRCRDRPGRTIWSVDLPSAPLINQPLRSTAARNIPMRREPFTPIARRFRSGANMPPLAGTATNPVARPSRHGHENERGLRDFLTAKIERFMLKTVRKQRRSCGAPRVRGSDFRAAIHHVVASGSPNHGSYSAPARPVGRNGQDSRPHPTFSLRRNPLQQNHFSISRFRRNRGLRRLVAVNVHRT
jgi:hypothetical protein